MSGRGCAVHAAAQNKVLQNTVIKKSFVRQESREEMGATTVALRHSQRGRIWAQKSLTSLAMPQPWDESRCVVRIAARRIEVGPKDPGYPSPLLPNKKQRLSPPLHTPPTPTGAAKRGYVSAQHGESTFQVGRTLRRHHEGAQRARPVP